MKKFFYGIMIFTTVIITACSSSTPEVKMSAEMQGFTEMINGTSDAVSAALEKYGANQDVIDSDMAIYGLDDPIVTEKNGNCYTVQFKSGIAMPVFELCWENGKIISVTDKGFK